MSERPAPYRHMPPALLPETNPDVGGSTAQFSGIDYDGAKIMKTVATTPTLKQSRIMLPSYPTRKDDDIN